LTQTLAGSGGKREKRGGKRNVPRSPASALGILIPKPIAGVLKKKGGGGERIGKGERGST